MRRIVAALVGCAVILPACSTEASDCAEARDAAVQFSDWSFEAYENSRRAQDEGDVAQARTEGQRAERQLLFYARIVRSNPDCFSPTQRAAAELLLDE